MIARLKEDRSFNATKSPPLLIASAKVTGKDRKNIVKALVGVMSASESEPRRLSDQYGRKADTYVSHLAKFGPGRKRR